MTPAEAITSLLSRQWTEARIAEAVGTSQPTINRIKQGTSPRYAVGEALVRLAGTAAPEEKVA
jgi:transcriptional regulator with XRE-family HTH domain